MDTPASSSASLDLGSEQQNFVRELEVAMVHNDNLIMEEFMKYADDHPRGGWLHALQTKDLLFNMKSASAKFLIKYYPDVLQRMLLRDSYSVLVTGDPDQQMGGALHAAVMDGSRELFEPSNSVKGGALHAAVMGGSRELIELLAPSNSVKAHKQVFDALRHTLVQPLHVRGRLSPSLRSLQTIRRALQWRHAKKFVESNGDSSVTEFLKEFSQSVEDRGSIDKMIQSKACELDRAMATRTRGDDISADPWGVVLLWAAACRKPYIIQAFKDLEPELFRKITENVERCTEQKFADRLRQPGAIATDGISSDDLVYLLQQTMAMDEGDDQGTSSTAVRFHDLPKGIVQARFDIFHQTTKPYRWTPLHLAVALGYPEVVNLLLTAYPMEESDDPSRERSKKDDRDQWLADLRTGLRRDKASSPRPFADSFGMTPLHYAVHLKGGSEIIVQMLLRSVLFRSHINDSDIFRRTALHVACDRNATPVIIKALARNTHIDINAQDCCLFTPLHWAVYSGATNACRCLLEEASEKIRSTKNRHGNHQYKMAVYKRIEETGKRNKRKGMTEREVENDTTELEHLLLQIPQVKQEVERLYRDRQVFVDAANAILVGAALIASVTFAGWLQPPLGNESESTFKKVRVYWVFNSLSFFFSVATLTAGAGAVLPVDAYIEDAVASIRRWLVVASALLLFCILFVLGAFASAGFASLSHVPHLKNHMIITTSLGSTLCAITGIAFLRRLARIRPDWLTTEKLLSKIQGIYNWTNTGPDHPDPTLEYPIWAEAGNEGQFEAFQRHRHLHDSEKCRFHARKLDSNYVIQVQNKAVWLTSDLP